MAEVKCVIHVTHEAANEARAVVVQWDVDGKLQRQYDELYASLMQQPDRAEALGWWLGEASVRVEEAVRRWADER